MSEQPLTPEARAAVMQLMGQTYGQMKKQDEMLVGSSNNLKPKSAEMKGLVEQLVRTPVAPANQAPGQAPPQAAPPQAAPQQAAPPAAAPAPVAPVVTPEQAMLELQQAEVAPAPTTVQQVEEQGMFDFSEPDKVDKLIELQKETNLLLKDIKLQLENSNARPKRKAAVKKAKPSVA